MSEIKPGMVVYVKTTEEPVYVVAVTKEPRYHGHLLADELAQFDAVKEQIAIVRRPLASDEGIRHQMDEFFVSELESDDARKERAMNEMMGMRNKLKALGGNGKAEQQGTLPFDEVLN